MEYNKKTLGSGLVVAAAYRPVVWMISSISIVWWTPLTADRPMRELATPPIHLLFSVRCRSTSGAVVRWPEAASRRPRRPSPAGARGCRSRQWSPRCLRGRRRCAGATAARLRPTCAAVARWPSAGRRATRWDEDWSSSSPLGTPPPPSAAHTRTHARLTALCPGLPRWAGTRKVKPIWILLKQETVSGTDISWAICKYAPRSRQIDNHASTPSLSFLTGRMPFLPPNQQRQSTEGTVQQRTVSKKRLVHWTGLDWSLQTDVLDT